MTENSSDASGAAEGEWAGSSHYVRVPVTSLLPGTERPPTAAVKFLNRAVKAAHTAIDRIADSAKPTVQQLGERLAGADDALHTKASQLRETGGSWADGLRGTVRGRPLTSVVAALALGALVARLAR